MRAASHGCSPLPSAQRLMQAHGLSYPTAFEAATGRYLLETLDVTL